MRTVWESFSRDNPAVQYRGAFWCRRDYQQSQATDHGGEEEKGVAQSRRVAALPITTAPTLEDFRVVETIDVIAAECAFGMNLFRDFYAGVTDLIGGRSQSTQNVFT